MQREAFRQRISTQHKLPGHCIAPATLCSGMQRMVMPCTNRPIAA
jgi:hypothetical protein